MTQIKLIKFTFLVSLINIFAKSQISTESYINYDDCYNVACSACGHGYDKLALATLRSILMFHDSKRALCFHIFAEPQLHEPLESGMKSLKQEFSSTGSSIYFNFRIKDIDYPEEFGSSEGWKKMFKPCSTQRLFIPLVMRDVPHLVYTDIDVLFVGPVSKMYENLENFNDDQVMAHVPEHQVGSGMGWYTKTNARHPFYPPLGLNAGLLLIDAKKIRSHRNFVYVRKEAQIQPNWEHYFKNASAPKTGLSYRKMLMPIQQEYGSKLIWGDQCLLNVLWALNPQKVYTIPCEFNYRSDHCSYGENCHRTPVAIHGSRQAFLKEGEQVNTFTLLYKAVQESTSPAEVLKSLRKKIQKYRIEKNGMVKMYGNREMRDYCLQSIGLIYKSLEEAVLIHKYKLGEPSRDREEL